MRKSIILTLALCFTPGCDKATEKKEDPKAEEKAEGTGSKADEKSDAKATGTAGTPDAKADAKPDVKEAAPAPAKK